MPYQALTVRPGVVVEKTPMLNEAGWSFSQFIRFFQGMLQKLGGWTRLISTPVIGTARALAFWEDEAGNQYLGIGTEQKLEVYSAGAIYDITPVQSTSQLTNPFTTFSGLTTVDVTDAAGSANMGDWINVVNPASIGGIIIQGSYLVQSILSPTQFTITIASPATSSVSLAGTAALFTTINTQANVKVTLNNHGYIPGNQYTVFISTNVGGLTLFGTYTVVSVTDANNFVITPGGNATSNDAQSENAGNIEIQYLLPSGNASGMNVSGLYGAGPYGAGPYGTGQIDTFSPPRLWSISAWGTDMVASYTSGPIYAWITENGLINNPATLITQSPKKISAGIFVAMPQQQLVALGASVGTSDDVDQLLIRWCDVADYTDWTATVINQAGSFRIPRGSHIVGGFQGPQQGLIWTDIGFWVMQYIGFPLVYGFNELGEGCGLIGQNAKGILGGRVIWMSLNGLFIYDGNSVQPLACAVWDKVFQNLDRSQVGKIFCAPNSYFNEMWFFWPSLSGNGEIDSYIKVNMTDGSWDYGTMVRTAWLDQSAFQYPLGVDGAGLIQQHELGNDDDGLPMVCNARTGWFKISDGTYYTFLERIIPDFIYENATLKITIFFRDYPNGPEYQIGPLTAIEAVTYLIVRGRGRLVSIQISSNDLGSFWRQGELLYEGSQTGRR